MSNSEIPETLVTDRLVLRRPRLDDATYVFQHWANDPDVATYMSWPRHESMATTEQVVDAWVEEWKGVSGGAFLITDRATGSVIGSTGFDLINPKLATTGYVLTKNEWGKGYATESLKAIVSLAHDLGVQRLFAYCHYEHEHSARVMEKCDFEFEGRLKNYMEFPNLSPGEVTDVLLYAWTPAAT